MQPLEDEQIWGERVDRCGGCLYCVCGEGAEVYCVAADPGRRGMYPRIERQRRACRRYEPRAVGTV